MNLIGSTVILAIILIIVTLSALSNFGQLIYTLSTSWNTMDASSIGWTIFVAIFALLVAIFVAVGGTKSLMFFRSSYKECKSIN